MDLYGLLAKQIKTNNSSGALPLHELLDKILKEMFEERASHLPEGEVGMYDGKFSTKKLHTSGVNGCSVFLYRSHAETPAGILTHYPPGDGEYHLRKIRTLVTNHPELLEGEKHAALIYSAGCERAAQELKDGTRIIIPDLDIQLVRYQLCTDPDPVVRRSRSTVYFNISTGKYLFKPVHARNETVIHYPGTL